jgi:hypothetical protein
MFSSPQILRMMRQHKKFAVKTTNLTMDGRVTQSSSPRQVLIEQDVILFLSENHGDKSIVR